MLTHQGDLATARESACKKAFWRVVPVLFLSYVFCSMDRYNIAFAQLQLREARHMSDSVYGLGASLFFVTYVLFAVPVNLLLKRWGARRLFFLIMLGWGLCSTSMLFIRTPAEFYLGRLALGAFEAGFYPGVIYYLATWFPQDRRSKAFAVFTSGVTVAGVIVGPLSGWIMTKFDSAAGLAGWQWVFLLEGVPSCVMSLACLVLLRRGPADAPWLSEEERHALCNTLERERSKNTLRRVTVQSFRYCATPESICLRSFISVQSQEYMRSASGCRRSSKATASLLRSRLAFIPSFRGGWQR